MDYSSYPKTVVEDIARIRRKITASGLPEKITDQNLIIGTWNIKAFGAVCSDFEEKPKAPKRTWRALASIAEVVSRMDIIAIQEVKTDTSGVRLLMKWLGPDWGLILTDVCGGDEGNNERLSFLFDRRRVMPSGLAGEITLANTADGNPALQFARPPYMVGFSAGEERFVLLSAHIKYGKVPTDRLPELTALAKYASEEIRARANAGLKEEANLIVLGDFNIDERGENPLFKEFVSTGLVVPPPLNGLRTAFGTKPKYYDQIAWFMGDMNMNFNNAGVIDFAGAVYPEISLTKMSHRVSDHFPLWAEFCIDHSVERMAKTLGVDPAMPDPLSIVP
jgi:hypothetical protein